MPISRFFRRTAKELRTELLLASWKLGVYVPPDRKTLDGIILPYYATTNGFERMLFVGVKWYNERNRALFRGRTYATIDPNLQFARFGGQPHVVDRLENVANHFPPLSFDVIVINGVLGHGLNAKADIEIAIAGCYSLLRDKGEMVLGINELSPASVDIEAIAAIKSFEPCVFGPLGGAKHVIATPLRERSHTFLFYRKLSSAMDQ